MTGAFSSAFGTDIDAQAATPTWPTLSEVKAHLRLKPEDTRDDVAIDDARLAAIRFFENRVLLPTANGEAYVNDDLAYACQLLTQRLLARRNSPEGIVGFGDGAVMRIAMRDSDISDLAGPYWPVVVA